MQRNNLATRYSEKIVPALMAELNIKNRHSVPAIKKIVINVGVGRLSQQPHFGDKLLPEISKEISIITGQKPAPRLSKKSIAGFKVREGQIVGMQVTLRGKIMYDFLGRLINLVLPRTRDFRGIDVKSIDSHGNLTVGLGDQYVFPEISAETSIVNFGMEITIVNSAKNRANAIALYRAIGVPLKKDK